MATPSQGWKWDERYKDYYRYDWSPSKNEWVHTWARDSTPRTPYVSQPHPQPLTGTGSRTAAPRPSDPVLTQAFNTLTIEGSQTQSGYPQGGRQPNYYLQSSTAGVTSRSETSDQSGTIAQLPRSSSMIEPSRTNQSRAGSYTSRYSVNQPTHGRSIHPNAGYEIIDERTTHGVGLRPDSNSLGQGQPLSDVAPVARGQHNRHTSFPQENRGSRTALEEQSSAGSHSRRQSNHLHSTFSPNLGDGPLRDGILDPNDFKQITHKRKKFFVVGKVFMMLFIENAGETSDRNSHGNTNFTTVAHGEVAHHQFRRFVVVEERSDFCYCCPITTYGSRATAKQGVDQSSHTIVYSGNYPPAKLAGETHMNKDPLRILLNRQDEKLDPKSRINLGKKYPIEHNYKVKDIGNVDKQSLPKLLQYVRVVNSPE